MLLDSCCGEEQGDRGLSVEPERKPLRLTNWPSTLPFRRRKSYHGRSFVEMGTFAADIKG
jgi:hypothetical protein